MIFQKISLEPQTNNGCGYSQIHRLDKVVTIISQHQVL